MEPGRQALTGGCSPPILLLGGQNCRRRCDLQFLRRLWRDDVRRAFPAESVPGAEREDTAAAGEPAGVDPERAIERLAEDEALRDDLTDEEFGPLLGAVALMAMARSEQFPTTDELYLALHRLLTGAVEAVQNPAAEPALAVTSALLSDREQTDLRERLDGLPAVGSGRAEAIAAAISEIAGPP